MALHARAPLQMLVDWQRAMRNSWTLGGQVNTTRDIYLPAGFAAQSILTRHRMPPIIPLLENTKYAGAWIENGHPYNDAAYSLITDAPFLAARLADIRILQSFFVTTPGIDDSGMQTFHVVDIAKRSAEVGQRESVGSRTNWSDRCRSSASAPSKTAAHRT